MHSCVYSTNSIELPGLPKNGEGARGRREGAKAGRSTFPRVLQQNQRLRPRIPAFQPALPTRVPTGKTLASGAECTEAGIRLLWQPPRARDNCLHSRLVWACPLLTPPPPKSGSWGLGQEKKRLLSEPTEPRAGRQWMGHL